MMYVVDKIENGCIYLESESEQIYEIPQKLIPEAKEGDCVDIYINKEETEKRRENVRRLMEELFRD